MIKSESLVIGGNFILYFVELVHLTSIVTSKDCIVDDFTVYGLAANNWAHTINCSACDL